MWSAYLAGDAQVTGWFAAGWRSVDELARHADEDHRSVDRGTLAAILARSLAERQAPAAARAAADRLGGDALAVITGQQPAHGLGPLYTLVKVAHAIAIARGLSALGVPSVAVYWCGSEDHDLGEAGHADLLQRDGDIQRLHRDFDRLGASLRFQDAGTGFAELTRALQALELGHLGRDWWQQHAPQRGEPLGRWTCRVLESLFAADGLVCVEAHQLRPLFVGALERALEAWPEAALAARADELRARGFAPSLGPLASPPLFLDDADGRRPITADQAAPVLATDPTRLSPGAGLRPILQQAALPGIAYVAGPGELAYHAQLAPLYPALRVAPPRLVPRISATLIAPHVARGLERWGCTVADLAPGRPLPTPAIGADHRELLAELDRALGALAGRAPGDRCIAAAVARLRRERDRLHASLERGARAAAGRIAPGQLRAWLYPHGRPQDRSFAGAQALWCWGPGLARELVAAATAQGPGAAVHLGSPA